MHVHSGTGTTGMGEGARASPLLLMAEHGGTMGKQEAGQNLQPITKVLTKMTNLVHVESKSGGNNIGHAPGHPSYRMNKV